MFHNLPGVSWVKKHSKHATSNSSLYGTKTVSTFWYVSVIRYINTFGAVFDQDSNVQQ